ncbi:Glucose dehydrogenase [Daphnia magna]|uniref:Glucose dehydrogenase n=1 Tax=Daphnia magna TaxID=35525 RepID=A0A164SNQ6_9CRUS|nr:Glucose dehydrogenase [Daphnia magna]
MFLTQIFGNLSLWASFPAFLLYYLFYSSFEMNDPEGYVTDAETILTEYDFIVIGAGSAGAVVANRLTEVSNWNVLLLEVGGDEGIVTDIPGAVHLLQRTSMDWQYKTMEQTEACLAFNDNKSNWPRGKILGGSSVLNYMLYVRGNKRDYDDWEAKGNIGWSYDDVLPYFIKSEDNRNPYIAANTKYHGTGGYLTVQEPAWTTPLAVAFVEAGVEMDYESNDGNAAKQTGFMLTQATNRRGHRCSTAKAFLRPIRNRQNFHISMYSHVHKIIIDPVTKQATAVRFEKKGQIYQVNAKKVSCPADHLQSFGIPVIEDLPVGDNLQDHIALGGMVFTVNKPFGAIEGQYYAFPALLNYKMNSAGPLASLLGCEALAWVNTKYADPSSGEDDIWEKYYNPLMDKDMWQVIPMLLRPESTGTIRLASSDPYTAPLIDPKYFSKIQDLNVLIEGTKIGLALSKMEAFQKLGSKFYAAIFPGCEQFTPWTDEYWGCFIRHFSSTIYHPSGTCKMGPSSDKTAVVDPTLKVYGIKGLRVIDCSIMSKIVSGNTNAPAVS